MSSLVRSASPKCRRVPARTAERANPSRQEGRRDAGPLHLSRVAPSPSNENHEEHEGRSIERLSVHASHLRRSSSDRVGPGPPSSWSAHAAIRSAFNPPSRGYKAAAARATPGAATPARPACRCSGEAVRDLRGMVCPFCRRPPFGYKPADDGSRGADGSVYSNRRAGGSHAIRCRACATARPDACGDAECVRGGIRVSRGPRRD